MLNAVHFYRVSRFLYLKKIPLLPWVIEKVIFFMYNSVVPNSAEIGKGTFLAYGGVGVIIHSKTIIGQNVNIGSNVTIGGRSGQKGLPIIGDNVFIGTGAKILGDIKIGNNAVIGANAVVIYDVEENTVVGGIPAKMLKYRNEISKKND